LLQAIDPAFCPTPQPVDRSVEPTKVGGLEPASKTKAPHCC
jgi:hypothetical protein